MIPTLQQVGGSLKVAKARCRDVVNPVVSAAIRVFCRVSFLQWVSRSYRNKRKRGPCSNFPAAPVVISSVTATTADCITHTPKIQDPRTKIHGPPHPLYKTAPYNTPTYHICSRKNPYKSGVSVQSIHMSQMLQHPENLRSIMVPHGAETPYYMSISSLLWCPLKKLLTHEPIRPT